MAKVAEFKVHEIGGSFVVVPYDGRGKPIQGHPLGTATFASREQALSAIQMFASRESRAGDRESSS